jgi:hypothetical protein
MKEVNPNDVFVVGIMFANKPKYIEALHAESETWMSAVSKERIFAVGPADAIADREGFPRAIQSPCSDRELWCKRIQHIPEAFKMLQSGINFDWLLSGNEDWYVHLPSMRKALADNNPDDPIVFSALGCSMTWKHTQDSKNGTVQKPSNFIEHQQCEAVSKKGGICAGNGVVFSRGAIEIMMEDGEESLFNITTSQPFDWRSHPQDDPVLSCLIYALEHKGVHIELKPWHGTTTQNIFEYGSKFPLRHLSDSFTTVHALSYNDLTPAQVLKKLHLMFTHASIVKE